MDEIKSMKAYGRCERLGILNKPLGGNKSSCLEVEVCDRCHIKQRVDSIGKIPQYNESTESVQSRHFA